MALNKQTYIDLIKAGFDSAKKINNNPDAQSQAIYEGIANAIIKAFQDADIQGTQFSVGPGIPVATAGTPAAQTGATTGPGSVIGVGKIT